MTEPIVFSARTPHLGLPLLYSAQAEKEVTLNEALMRLDHLIHSITEGEAATPPAGAIDGDLWIVASGASGDWAGQDNKLACHIAGGWVFIEPRSGLRIFDRAMSQLRIFDAEWQQAASISPLEGGDTVDSEARAAIREISQVLREARLLR